MYVVNHPTIGELYDLGEGRYIGTLGRLGSPEWAMNLDCRHQQPTLDLKPIGDCFIELRQARLGLGVSSSRVSVHRARLGLGASLPIAIHEPRSFVEWVDVRIVKEKGYPKYLDDQNRITVLKIRSCPVAMAESFQWRGARFNDPNGVTLGPLKFLPTMVARWLINHPMGWFPKHSPLTHPSLRALEEAYEWAKEKPFKKEQFADFYKGWTDYNLLDYYLTL